MRAGSLRNLITVEKPVEVADANGNPSIEWREHCQAFAEVTNRFGRQFFEGGQHYQRQLFVFKVRWDDADGVTPIMRVKHNSVAYRVTTVIRDEQRGEWARIETEIFDETSRP